MKVTFEYDVSGCTDCPFRNLHRGQGEYWQECTNKNSGKSGYDSILKDGIVPSWCPLGLGKENYE